jgi:hypothetical protein
MQVPMSAFQLLELLGPQGAQQKSLWVQFALGGPYQTLQGSMSPLVKPNYLAVIDNQFGNKPLSMR